MITARQFAELRDVPYTTVIFWLRKGVLEGAEKQEIPFGRQGFIWQVLDNAPLPESPMGPKTKPGDTDGQAAASPVTKKKHAKPGKKVRGKKGRDQ